jgi:hypothetical protein
MKIVDALPPLQAPNDGVGLNGARAIALVSKSAVPASYAAAAKCLAALHPDPQMCDPRPVRKWSDRAYMFDLSKPQR